VGVERHTDPLVDQGHGLGHAPEGPGIPWSADGDQGPFRWVRHPVYADNMRFGLGISISFLGLPCLLLTIIAFRRTAIGEEMPGSPLAFGTEC